MNKKNLVRFIGGLGLVAVIAAGAAALISTPEVEAAGPGGQPCGGIQGLECPSPRQICIDDPRDDCNPKTGGADCIGICRGPGGGGPTQ